MKRSFWYLPALYIPYWGAHPDGSHGGMQAQQADEPATDNGGNLTTS